MKFSIARLAFVVIVCAALAAAFFRVTTAEERASERRALAKAVCTSAGGVWLTIQRAEVCNKGDLAKKD